MFLSVICKVLIRHAQLKGEHESRCSLFYLRVRSTYTNMHKVCIKKMNGCICTRICMCMLNVDSVKF